MSMIDQGSSRTMSAMFDSRADADRAVSALRAEGIADVVLTGEDNPGYMASESLSGATRTESRGFFEALGDFFFPDEDRYTYAEGLNRGGFLVTVRNVPADKMDRALDILDDEGAVDLDARESEWRSSGWSYEGQDTSGSSVFTGRDEGRPGTMASRAVDSVAGALSPDGGYDDGRPGTMASRGMDSVAGALSGEAGRDDGLPGTMASRAVDRTGDALAGDRTYAEDDLNRDGVIDVVEERMQIAKRERDLGRVRVRSYVREVPVEEAVNLREEHVTIERRPVDRAATNADFQDQSIEAREYAEEAIVSKEARVVEEIAVSSDVQNREEVVRDTLRKTEVEVEDERGTTVEGGLGTGRDKDRI